VSDPVSGAADGALDAPVDAPPEVAAGCDAAPPLVAAGAWLAGPELHAPTRIVRLANAPSTRSFVFIFSVSPPETRWTAGGAGCWSSARCGAGRSFATLRPVGPRPALTSV